MTRLLSQEGRVDALDMDDMWSFSSGKIDKFRLDHCGFIFQGFNLFGALSALQQVTIILKYKGFSPAEARARADANAVKFGRTKEQKAREAADAARARAELDGKQRETDAD